MSMEQIAVERRETGSRIPDRGPHDKFDIRTDWTIAEVEELYNRPLFSLAGLAHDIHRHHFPDGDVQLSTLLNIKEGGCPEDCKYCSQSSRYDTGLRASKLMDAGSILEKAKAAKAAGSTRFCMGAAWRSPKDRDLDKIAGIVSDVKSLGMETCLTLGMLTAEQARRLKDAGLDYYNHNIDTSKEHYAEVITSRTFEDRLQTLANVREAGVSVCCGGILGLGEDGTDRVSMLHTLATLPDHPGSIPVNMLVPIEGTPYSGNDAVDIFDLVRTICAARILMPKSVIRLSAGRKSLTDEGQALCFFAGVNSIFYGDALLTTENPEQDSDIALLEKLGLKVQNVKTHA